VAVHFEAANLTARITLGAISHPENPFDTVAMHFEAANVTVFMMIEAISHPENPFDTVRHRDNDHSPSTT
jgi:hypothetical protein